MIIWAASARLTLLVGLTYHPPSRGLSPFITESLHAQSIAEPAQELTWAQSVGGSHRPMEVLGPGLPAARQITTTRSSRVMVSPTPRRPSEYPPKMPSATHQLTAS